MDLSKLTPAPWKVDCVLEESCPSHWCVPIIGPNGGMAGHVYGNESRMSNAHFIALARNAFDGDPEALAWWEANRNRREHIEGEDK
jgi:hypothetical protein